MRCTLVLFFLTTLGLSESVLVLKTKQGRALPNRNSVKLERGIVAKRFNHRGHIVQQGINNGTVRLHLSDESGASENAKRLHIVHRGDNDGGNTLHTEDEANEFRFGSNTGNNGTVVQEGANKGGVGLTVAKSDAPMAKRLNDPSDSYLFRINNGSIGQQGENTGEIDLMSKPKEGTVVQQGLNKGTLAFTDKGKRTYGLKDKFTFKDNNGTIAQQGISSGKIELNVRDESGRGGYAKRQSNADKFYFAANNGSIEQKGSNAGEVAETITRDFHPKASPLNDPKDYDFKPNNGTIIQQGLNTGTIKLPGKPYVGNIPQEGKNEGIILYNGKEVKPRDAPSQLIFTGKSSETIDQKGTNTGNIKEQE